MQEQPIIHRQGTEFQPDDQVNLHESNLISYEQIEVRRLVDQAYEHVNPTVGVDNEMTADVLQPSEQPEVLSYEDRIGRIGLNLAAIRKLAQSDFDLAA